MTTTTALATLREAAQAAHLAALLEQRHEQEKAEEEYRRSLLEALRYLYPALTPESVRWAEACGYTVAVVDRLVFRWQRDYQSSLTDKWLVVLTGPEQYKDNWGRVNNLADLGELLAEYGHLMDKTEVGAA